jgi:hypothetical protein
MIDDLSFRERFRAHNNKMRGKALGEDGKKLYFVQTEYVKYPFLYIWASSARSAEKHALDRPSSEFFDFPERPRKWEIIGEVEPVSNETVKELDLHEKEHPEAE